MVSKDGIDVFKSRAKFESILLGVTLAWGGRRLVVGCLMVQRAVRFQNLDIYEELSDW